MTSKQLVHATLRGEPTPRPAAEPLACHFCGRYYGIALRDYALDADKLADSVIRYYHEFRPDAVWVSADTWVSAEAMGAPGAFSGRRRTDVRHARPDLPHHRGSREDPRSRSVQARSVPPDTPEEDLKELIRVATGACLSRSVLKVGMTFFHAVSTLIGIMAIAAPAHADLDLHVAAEAGTAEGGTAEAPFSTLTAARDAIRAARKSGTLKADEPVTVHVRSGTYPLGSSFELTAEDGGTAEAPVVYRAEEIGKSRLQGGIALDPAAFKPVEDPDVLLKLDASIRVHVRVCDLSKSLPGELATLKTSFCGVPAGPWLYVDRQPMTLARWPNAEDPDGGWATFSKTIDSGLPKADSPDPAQRKLHPGSFVFDDPRPARWHLDSGVWLLGYWTHDWSDEVIRVASYDAGKKAITLAAPHNYGIKGGTWGNADRRFFAMNVIEELDAPGEWYLDRARKLLYYYPEAHFAHAEINLATLTQPLVKMTGSKHVKMLGLAFEFGHANGVELQNTTDVELAGCEFANLASAGVTISGTGNTIRSCNLHNLGKGGISLNGGDRRSLTPGKNLAVNNHIHHYGLFQRTYAPGIGVSGCGQVVRNNRIHDAPHNAILYGGNDHLFELNHIYRVVMETGDAGAFYTGRDWTSQGNVLRHNYIHDLGGDAEQANTMGVYLDDCDSGDTIEGNIFYRAGRAIMIGGGRDNPIINNLVIDCPIGLHIDARGMTWKQWNDPKSPSWNLEKKAEAFDYRTPPWSVHYPRLARISHTDI